MMTFLPTDDKIALVNMPSDGRPRLLKCCYSTEGVHRLEGILQIRLQLMAHIHTQPLNKQTNKQTCLLMVKVPFQCPQNALRYLQCILFGKRNEIFFAVLYLGTLTPGICLDLDCFQYCCIKFQEF